MKKEMIILIWGIIVLAFLFPSSKKRNEKIETLQNKIK